MRLWHSAAATSAQFDDPNLVSHAGLVPVMRLAQDCGLTELVGEQVTVAGPLGANTPHKIGCVVAGQYPQLNACSSPKTETAQAKIYFRAQGAATWFYVLMKSEVFQLFQKNTALRMRDGFGESGGSR